LRSKRTAIFNNKKRGLESPSSRKENSFTKELFFSKLLPIPWKTWPIEARFVIGLLAFWCISGLLILGSASWWVANKEMGDGAYYIKRQFIWLIVSWSLFGLVISTKLKILLKSASIFLLSGFILIGLTLIIGSTVNGSSRWLIIGPLQLQPSELIKPFIILQAANIFSQWKRVAGDQKLFWLIIWGGLIILILKQPNLSTAGLTGIMLWMIALASGQNFRNLSITATSGILLATISILSNEYQKMRLITFMDPWIDPQGNGYQLIQSLLAIGSGGWFGEGYGLSTQKLQYLPIQSTDFIYAVFAEEFGFIGSLMLFLLLILFSYIGLKIALKCRTNQSKLVAIGCIVLLVGQSILNIAVASGVLPTTGLPLPMISYGGNSLLSSLFIGGLLVRCSLESSEIFKNF
tara:strand:+ start:5694 stop:6911 length:1218 start_codon:yes stop_codon:yes gene_type:complete